MKTEWYKPQPGAVWVLRSSFVPALGGASSYYESGVLRSLELTYSHQGCERTLIRKPGKAKSQACWAPGLTACMHWGLQPGPALEEQSLHVYLKSSIFVGLHP